MAVPRKAEIILSDVDHGMDKVIPISRSILAFIADRMYDCSKEVDFEECIGGADAVSEFEAVYSAVCDAIEWLGDVR